MIEMMLYLFTPHWTYSQLDYLTDRTFLNLISDIHSHIYPLIPPSDMAFKVLLIPQLNDNIQSRLTFYLLNCH